MKAKLLYEKYIKNGSQFEINVSSRDRDVLWPVFNGGVKEGSEMDSLDLYGIFDKCMDTMRQFAVRSLRRLNNQL